MPTAKCTRPELEAKVERHERLLYGIDDSEVGLKAKSRELERYVEELKLERKEAKDDRRHILRAVIAGTAINVTAVILALLITHSGG
jgi:hypothetical protein